MAAKPAVAVQTEAESTRRLREIFEKSASVKEGGHPRMTFNDFQKVVTVDHVNVHSDTLKFLFDLADRNGSGSIEFEEYLLFETMMSAPDADYQICYALFDANKKGHVTKEDFQQTLKAITSRSAIPFSFGTDWSARYFGTSNQLTYNEFTQVLKGLGSERWRQAFGYFDKNKQGFITGDQFVSIIRNVNDGKLAHELKEKLASMAGLVGDRKISYAEYVAFFYILRDLSHYDVLIHKHSEAGVSRDDLMREARGAASFEVTPLEIDFLFKMFGNPADGRIYRHNYERLLGSTLSTEMNMYRKIEWHQAQEKRTAGTVAVESVINFALGSVAGAIGAFAVYPIDLVKTRMQNQRVVEAAQRLYKNSFDCFGKVFKHEGIRGLYRGLLPQMVGVAPEKAIKLTMNDFLRGLFRDPARGDIYLPLEILAGGGAGASQVLFTNPLEIVKIRLQTQGEAMRLGTVTSSKGTMQIISELGFFGLYKGAGACLLRDIPFSAIYFPTYAAAKTNLSNRRADKKPQPIDLLLAGAIAGVPAASLVTPADVIKTRLQVEARKGQQTYSGIRDCFWKVLKAEGAFAFGKGAGARVFRSSPQFGVTLLAYELLHKWLAPHLTHRPPEAAVSASDAAVFMTQRNVLKVKELENKWLIPPSAAVPKQESDK